MDMRNDVAEILYTEDQLAEIVARMGRRSARIIGTRIYS